MEQQKIFTVRYKTPVGEVELGSLGDSLCLCLWPHAVNYGAVRRRLARGLDAGWVDGQWTDVLRLAVDELRDRYFAGQPIRGLPLRTVGTPFQREVWSQVGGIPRGTTVTYGELAALVGRPSAVRAVASAVGANALNLFVPCHRVVPADGSVGNYAGLPYCKYRLLRMEGVGVDWRRTVPYGHDRRV